MNLETLEKFTHPWNTTYKAPFFLEGMTWATDGHTLLRVYGNLTNEASKPDDFIPLKIKSHFEGPFSEIFSLRDFHTEELFSTCQECGGSGFINECPECGGSGEVEWDSGWNLYSAECMSCYGSGVVEGVDGGEECENCEGTGKVSERTLVQVGNLHFDNRKLNKLIANLPPETIIKVPEKGSSSPAVFVWSGGDGLLMPVLR